MDLRLTSTESKLIRDVRVISSVQRRVICLVVGRLAFRARTHLTKQKRRRIAR